MCQVGQDFIVAIVNNRTLTEARHTLSYSAINRENPNWSLRLILSASWEHISLAVEAESASSALLDPSMKVTCGVIMVSIISTPGPDLERDGRLGLGGLQLQPAGRLGPHAVHLGPPQPLVAERGVAGRAAADELVQIFLKSNNNILLWFQELDARECSPLLPLGRREAANAEREEDPAPGVAGLARVVGQLLANLAVDLVTQLSSQYSVA